MKIIFAPQALEDFAYWQKTGNIAILKRIQMILEAIGQDPFNGIGKPEALKHDWSGFWSRRINKENTASFIKSATKRFTWPSYDFIIRFYSYSSSSFVIPLHTLDRFIHLLHMKRVSGNREQSNGRNNRPEETMGTVY